MRRSMPACVVLAVAVSAFAQTAPPPPVELPPVVSTPPAPAPSPVTHSPGGGINVSLLNGSSSLKLFAQFSTLGVFSSTRPFPAGDPLLLLPRLDPANRTNTFDLHARQTSFGAAFSGPEVMGFTPSATALVFIQNDRLTSDADGLVFLTQFLLKF